MKLRTPIYSHKRCCSFPCPCSISVDTPITLRYIELSSDAFFELLLRKAGITGMATGTSDPVRAPSARLSGTASTKQRETPPTERRVPGARRLFFRWILLGALLLGELAFLTVNFDSPDLAGVESWWAKLLRNSPAILSWGVSASLAGVLIGGKRLRDEMNRTVELASAKSTALWWP